MKSAKLILAFVNAKINEYTSALAAESNPILKEHLKQILAEYSAIKGFITIDDKKWVDLGLPSGLLWATENEALDKKKHFTFGEALETFGKQLPSAEAWEELFDHCSREWDDNRKGYILTGPNGNTLFLPAEGFIGLKKDKTLQDVGDYGFYWSSTQDSRIHAKDVGFRNENIHTNKYEVFRNNINVLTKDSSIIMFGFSVRLTRKYEYPSNEF